MSRKLRIILLVFFAAAFLFCAGYLGVYYSARQHARGELEELASQMQQPEQFRTTPSPKPSPTPTPSVTPEPTEIPEPPVTSMPEPTEPVMLRKFQKLYNSNDDLVGWLTVPKTNINLPVMQTRDNQNYYLHRGWTGDYSVYGLPFVDAGSDVESSDNVIIYAHKKNDGSMFGQLEKFADEEYWRERRYFFFDTLYEERTYEIIAVYRARILKQSEEGFRYYRFFNAENAEEFDEYIANIKALALYDTGVSAEYGDKLVTLSTCAYHAKGGRFVVVGKLVED